jgi:hypothetical protein
MRVPQATIESISARIAFSSTEARAIAPLGRGIVLDFGNVCGGSAGSFATDDRCAAGCCCAKETLAKITTKPKLENKIRSLFIWWLPEAPQRSGEVLSFLFHDYFQKLFLSGAEEEFPGLGQVDVLANVVDASAVDFDAALLDQTRRLAL